MNEKERITRDFLNELHLSRDYKGYNYIYSALLLLIEETELLTCITKCIYAEIAAQYGTKITNVEKNMRTAMHIIWDRNKHRRFFRGWICCPSNGDCLDILLYEIEERLRERACEATLDDK